MTSARARMALALGRVLVRETRASARVWLRPQTAWLAAPLPMRVDGTQVAVRPGRPYETVRPLEWWTQRRAAGRGTLVPWVITCDDRPVGELTIHLDAGTATAEIVASVRRDAMVWTTQLMRVALSAALTWLAGHSDTAVTVRVPLGAPAETVTPDADTLTSLGLALVATFPGDPDGPWPGEQHWQPAGGPTAARADR